MTGQLNISVPATLTVLGGSPAISSLAGPGPGISVSGAAASDTISVQLIAGNAAATIGLASSAGVSVSQNQNTLSLTGTQAQVNAALAGLELTEPANAGTDTLRLTASDTAAVAAGSAFAVDIVPATGPAFVAPLHSLTMRADVLNPVSTLRLADPVAAGLAAMGLGAEETLSVTLSTAGDVLLLPGLDGVSGISASGLGTGTITLSLTANELGALNTLLAGLLLVGPPGVQNLNYTVWNAAGVLPRTLTSSGIFLHTIGTAASAVLAAGGQTVITGGTVFPGTLGITGIDTVLGTLTGGAIDIAPGAALALPYDNMALSGTSADFGALSAHKLTLGGTLLAGGQADFAGQVALGAGARLEFADGLTAFGAVPDTTFAALALAAGAVVQGNGTLTAGNFSESAEVSGGTLQALGGTTFEIDAGLITGGAQLQVAGGGVMVLNAISALYGIFDTTPLTIDSSVTLSFLGAGAQPVTGIYAGTLGGAGGAFVLEDGPPYFAGTVTGFGAGDALIFPGAGAISVTNIGSASFDVAGPGLAGSYTIHTSIAAGYTPAVARDAEGDAEVVMLPPAATVTQSAVITATAGVPQPLLGASIALPGGTAQSLSLTLSAAHGLLSSDGAAAARITLTAASITALNAELAAVRYSGTGVADAVTLASNAAPLAGLTGSIAIGAGSSGTISGTSGQGLSEANLVVFGPAAGLPQVTAPMAVGGLSVSGVVEFEGMAQAAGLGGTALVIDGAGVAIFGAGAAVSLGADVTLGDAMGAGTLTVLSEDFDAGGDVTLAAAAQAAGSEAAVLGAASIAGALDIGNAAAALVVTEGTLEAGALSLGAAGTLQALGTAQAGFGTVSNAGTILLTGTAQAAASAYQGSGELDLGGTSMLMVAGLASVSGAAPVISIGTGAEMDTGSFYAAIGSIYDAGVMSVTGAMRANNMQLDGGTLLAGSLLVGGMITGHGVIASPSLISDGIIEAQGGRLLLNGGTLDNNGRLIIGATAQVEIAGAFSGGPVTFAGSDAVLVLDDAAASSFNVVQMTAADGIDLVGIAPSLVSVPASGGGAGAILNSLGHTLSTFNIGLAGTLTHHVSIVSDGAGGSLLTLDGQLPCFARGTGILSPHGYRPVESLRPNDPVITANGVRRPVRWIGWRTLDLGPRAARAARPVLVMPHAFGPGKPARLLRLSPSHCIYTGGVLIPVELLVNGATVLRETAAQAATYFHIELDRHDILLAEGLACESYFDDGNRAAMYQELGRRCPARRAYAPVVSSGARLAAARRFLHEQALAAGFSTRFWPSLRGVAAGQSAIPEILRDKQGRVARFHFAQPVRELVLLSATACPADTDPDSEDRRELGVCLGPVRGARLASGWEPRAAGDIGTWMGARATLAWTCGRKNISLPLAAIMQSWHRAPVDAGRAGG